MTTCKRCQTEYVYGEPERGCPTCSKSAQLKWRTKRAGMHLGRTYGITMEQFEQIKQAQDGKCAICKTNPATHVDHCHETGIIRGILCHKCNTGLGLFNDDAGILDAAALYVRHYK